MSMDIATNLSQIEEKQGLGPARDRGRRGFLKLLAGGAGVTAAVTASGCDFILPNPGGGETAPSVNLGSGDFGVLNYAYALEQLEAAFYTAVAANFYGGSTEAERTALTKIRDHEVVHRDFLKAALGANAIIDLTVDFSSVDFDSRTSVLATARVFEDLGVAAYNGAGKLLTSDAYLTIAGKIVSVEARHASAIRDMITAQSRFSLGADVVDDNGLDRAMTPSMVLREANPFIANPIIASNLPTT